MSSVGERWSGHNAQLEEIVRLKAKLADRERRIGLARETLYHHQRLTGAQHGNLIDVLDLRRPLRRKR